MANGGIAALNALIRKYLAGDLPLEVLRTEWAEAYVSTTDFEFGLVQESDERVWLTVYDEIHERLEWASAERLSQEDRKHGYKQEAAFRAWLREQVHRLPSK